MIYGFQPLWWIFRPFWPYFRALPVILQVKYSWTTNRNMRFLIKMRGRWSLYDYWFMKLGFWPFWRIFDPFWCVLAFFMHFRSSERYIMYETLIEKWVLRSDWGIYQVSTINGSRDIGFGPFWAFFDLLGQNLALSHKDSKWIFLVVII